MIRRAVACYFGACACAVIGIAANAWEVDWLTWAAGAVALAGLAGVVAAVLRGDE